MKKSRQGRWYVALGAVFALGLGVGSFTFALTSGAGGAEAQLNVHRTAAFSTGSTFPAAGTDSFNSSAEVVVQAPCSTGQTFDVHLEGPTMIQRSDPTTNATNQRTISTQITSLNLTGVDPTLGTVKVTLNPTMPSMGMVTANGPSTGPDFPASSFFDVFVEIQTGGSAPMQLHNNQPAVMKAPTVTELPPLGSMYSGETAPLLDPGGNVVACMINAQHVPSIDHFLCYTAKVVHSTAVPGFSPPSGVALQNQFSSFDAVPVTVTNHCNPVQKTLPGGQVTPITNPDAHLLCWKITASTQKPVTANVTNQFGTAELTTSQPNSLCLPSWKKVAGPPNQPVVQPPGLDHFTCYPAHYVAGTPPFPHIPSSVTLQDQFGSFTTKVGNPTVLCLPTQKAVNGVVTPITDAGDHLLCFAVKGRVKSVKPFDQNQFGTGRVAIMKVTSLCLQSAKSVVG